jgi:hypothetical protein
LAKTIPTTALGKLSLALIVLMPVLFFAGGVMTNVLYADVPAGNSILEDIAGRPALAYTMLAGMLSGVSAFAVGLFAIIRQKEQSPLVYVTTIAGALLLLFLAGEFLFPH